MPPRRREIALRQQNRFQQRARLADFAAARLNWADPVVLVTGFWRSGTTWLLETLGDALQAKTVFEPLSPQIRRYGQLIDGAGLSSAAARHAYIPNLNSGPDVRLWPYLDEAFRGHCSGDAAIMCRKRVSESLLRRVAVKDVRMQFSLAAVQARYAVPVIHIRRNPLAVAASLVTADWDWSFDDLRLSELLLPRAAELDELIGPGAVEQSLRLHDTDALSRIAAYWALTEAAAERQLARSPHHVLVKYETLLADPQAVITAICVRLNLQVRSPLQWERDSPVTAPSRMGVDRAARGSGWSKVLDRHDVTRVLDIVESAGAAALDPISAAPFTAPAP